MAFRLRKTPRKEGKGWLTDRRENVDNIQEKEWKKQTAKEKLFGRSKDLLKDCPGNRMMNLWIKCSLNYAGFSVYARKEVEGFLTGEFLTSVIPLRSHTDTRSVSTQEKGEFSLHSAFSVRDNYSRVHRDLHPAVDEDGGDDLHPSNLSDGGGDARARSGTRAPSE